jgi:hypothetical protein
VTDYLEAVADAAPAKPARSRPAPDPAGTSPRWGRTRAYLLPRVRAAVATPGASGALAPWATLGREGAFLGYELSWARRAPRGAVVVSSVERTLPAPTADPRFEACAYLVAPVGERWLIADKRCGKDFSDQDVVRDHAGEWEEPGELPEDVE